MISSTTKTKNPNITLVPYFGYQGHWEAPRSLVEALEVLDFIRPYVNDVKVNLFEIAYLTWDQVNLFRSDFREVARYYVQMRESGGLFCLGLNNVDMRTNHEAKNECQGEKGRRGASQEAGSVYKDNEAEGNYLSNKFRSLCNLSQAGYASCQIS